MLLADIITYNYNVIGKYEKNGSTMKNMPFDNKIPEIEQKKITLMHSSMQIGATIYMLCNIDSAFSPILGIQLAAFLMTLVRKNIIKANSWHIIYAFSLWINIFLYLSQNMSLDFITIQFTMYSIYTKLFFKIKLNKYIGWTILFGLFYIKQQFYRTIVIDIMIQYHLENIENYIRYFFTLVYLIREINKTKYLFLHT